jgi:uncharacterized membrane protein required for colicin V production
MNELDIILLAIILVGIIVGWRRGLVRVLISIVGLYITVVILGYISRPLGDLLSVGFGRLGIGLGTIGMRNFVYFVALIGITIVVEVASRNSFEATRIRSIGVLDNVLGALVGVFYGMLWASLLLAPVQYSVAREVSPWTTAVSGSALVPTLNRVFQTAVMGVVSIFFFGNVPEILRNSVSQRVAYLLYFLPPNLYPFV